MVQKAKLIQRNFSKCSRVADVAKRRNIFNYYRKRGQIICLQETHSEINDEALWTNEWGGKNFIFTWK